MKLKFPHEIRLAYSCSHEKGPPRIKICVVKKTNDPKISIKLEESAE